MQAARPWRRVLHNQRGFVLEQAIHHGTENVVICRLRYRLAAVAADGGGLAGPASDGASHPEVPGKMGPELPRIEPPPGQERPS